MNKKQNSPPARAAKEVKKGKPDTSDSDDENKDTEKAKVVVVHRTMKQGDSPDYSFDSPKRHARNLK